MGTVIWDMLFEPFTEDVKRIISKDVEDIIKEVAAAKVTERGGRADDLRSESAMEDRKKEGYF